MRRCNQKCDLKVLPLPLRSRRRRARAAGATRGHPGSFPPANPRCGGQGRSSAWASRREVKTPDRRVATRRPGTQIERCVQMSQSQVSSRASAGLGVCGSAQSSFPRATRDPVVHAAANASAPSTRKEPRVHSSRPLQPSTQMTLHRDLRSRMRSRRGRKSRSSLPPLELGLAPREPRRHALLRVLRRAHPLHQPVYVFMRDLIAERHLAHDQSLHGPQRQRRVVR
jgi:hypothetical protein